MLPNPEIHHLDDLPVYIRDNFMCRRRELDPVPEGVRACMCRQQGVEAVQLRPTWDGLRTGSPSETTAGGESCGATARRDWPQRPVGHRANDRAGRTRFLREFGGNDEIVVG